MAAQKNEKLDRAICKLVEGGAQLVDALDPALRAVVAKGIFHVCMWIMHAAKCCEPDPCPPQCPPPKLEPPC